MSSSENMQKTAPENKTSRQEAERKQHSEVTFWKSNWINRLTDTFIVRTSPTFVLYHVIAAPFANVTDEI